jgi:hypothetical protein
MRYTRLCCFSLAVVLCSPGFAFAQMPPTPYVPPAPILNPSTSLVVPQAAPVPVSPSISRSAPGSDVFGTGEYLRGTNQVVNPPRSVLHTSRYRHYHRHAQR